MSSQQISQKNAISNLQVAYCSHISKTWSVGLCAVMLLHFLHKKQPSDVFPILNVMGKTWHFGHCFHLNCHIIKCVEIIIKKSLYIRITKYIFQYTLHHQRSVLCLITSFWSLIHGPSFRPHHSGIRCRGHQHPGPWCGSTALLHREQVGRHHVASFWEPLRCRWAPGPTAHPSVTRYGSVTLQKAAILSPFTAHPGVLAIDPSTLHLLKKRLRMIPEIDGKKPPVFPASMS